MYIPLSTAGAFGVSQRAEPAPIIALGRRVRSLWIRLATSLRRDDSDPSLAVAEAAKVRALAWRVRDSQPGYASDLLAAADRHEQRFGADW